MIGGNTEGFEKDSLNKFFDHSANISGRLGKQANFPKERQTGKQGGGWDVEDRRLL